MKKSLIVLAALAVLSGCGMNEKTTCTNENKVGNITSKVTYEIEHKNNDVKKVILTYDYRDDHTDGVGTGTDGTTKDKMKIIIPPIMITKTIIQLKHQQIMTDL